MEISLKEIEKQNLFIEKIYQFELETPLSVLDDFRYLHILFDGNNAEHRRVFDLIKEIRFKKWSFDLYAVLFDTLEDQVIEEVLITIK